MSRTVAVFSALLATAALAAAPGKLPHDAPLIVDGEIVVDAADFEGNILRIPEGKRAEFRMSPERVSSVVDNIFISRVLAHKAREQGLDKDPAVQRRLQQVQDGVLGDLLVQKLEKEVVPGNMEQRARELYRVQQASFVSPEEVHVQHILVNLNGRTRETALARAQEAAREARSGADFLSVATKYSDDPDKSRNGGDLGYNAPTRFTEPVRKAIAAMKQKGEIAGPIESEYGFHIIRFIDRKPQKQLPFEAVKDRIIEAEVERLKRQRTEALIAEIRASPTVVVHRDNVSKLVVKVDPAAVQKALENAAAPKK